MTNPIDYPSIAISVGSEFFFYLPSEIIFCRSDGNNTILYLTGDRRLSTGKKLKDLESSLRPDLFVRVHHSYLINLMHVSKFVNDEQKLLELTEGHQILVSRRRKSEFIGRFVKL